VIPTIARPALLARCLDSVLDGDRRPDRVIVCDQSSDERTALAVDLRGDARVTCVRLRPPGASAARNLGIDLAETDLVAFIDDDCTAGPGWLAGLVDAYSGGVAGETIAAVAGPVLPVQSGAGSVPVASRTSMSAARFSAAAGALERGEWAPSDVGTGANLLAPRSILDAVGGFDATLGPGTAGVAGEDIDLLYRLARAGTLLYTPAARVFHPTTTRRGRLRSRVRYGRGMGAMLAARARAGDPAAVAQTSLYLRHQLAQSMRRGPWGPVETALTLIGAGPRLAPVLCRWLFHRRPPDGG
jgi:glycosyltransferase involved in cell wall biosynthesis